MSANGTMTMHKEMDDTCKETLYLTMYLGGRIAGSHDITQDTLYVYKEGQLKTERTEHKAILCPCGRWLVQVTEASSQEKGHVHLNFILL